MTDLADIHDIVEHLRKHTLGGEHDEEQVVDALVRVMDRRPDLRKLLKPADVAYLRTKKGAKGRYAFDESQHPRGQPENAGEFAPKGGGVAVSQPQQGQSQEQPRGNTRTFAQDSLGVIHRFANELLANNPQAAANAAASAKQLFQGYFEKLKQQAGPNHDAGKMKVVGRKLSKEYMDLANELSSGTFADTARREGMPVAIKELHQAFMDAKSLTGYEFENQFGEGSLDGMAGEENASQPSGENGEFGDSWDEQESVAFLQKYHDTPIKTKDDAQAAFRKAVLATHPDRGGDSAEFHKVRRAKDVLRFSVDDYEESVLARYAFDESQHPRGQPENAGEFATNPGGGGKKLSNEHKVGERSAKFAVKLAKKNGTPLEPIVLERLSEQLKGHPQERELLEQVRAVTQGQEPAQQAPTATPSKVESDKIASIGMSLDKPDSPALNTPQAVAADKAIREAIGGQAMLTYPGKGFVQIGNDEFMAVVSVRDVGGRGEVGTYIPVITPKSDDGHWQVGQTGISGGRAYRLPADATPEDIAMAVRANMPRKENGKLQITRDESFHLEELTRKLREARQQRRAAQYARDWNDLRATGRNVSRDEITAAASDLAGTGVYVAWNASDDAPGWEAVPAPVVDAVMGRYAREEPGGGVMFGGEVHTGDDEQERIHLIADILHGVYGDDVMSMFEDTGRYSREPDGRYAKWGPEEAAQHPRGPNGQFDK